MCVPDPLPLRSVRTKAIITSKKSSSNPIAKVNTGTLIFPPIINQRLPRPPPPPKLRPPPPRLPPKLLLLELPKLLLLDPPKPEERIPEPVRPAPVPKLLRVTVGMRVKVRGMGPGRGPT